MLKNFFQSVVRNLFKNRLYSFINIFGLAIGIACSLLILLWVQDELNFDKFIPKHDKLYQVWVNAEFDGKINTWRSVPLPTYPAMKSANHHIINSSTVSWDGEQLLTVGDKRLKQQGNYVSEEFLEMFEFPLISGDRSLILDEPYSIVITESLAQSFFRDEDPIGKMIRLNDQEDLKVTGVLKDLPGNSSFEFKFLLPWKLYETTDEWVLENTDNWGNYSFQVFIEVDDPIYKEDITKGVEDMLAKNGEDEMHQKLFIHPMDDWRLNSNFENGIASGGMIDYVKLFSVIAIFILVIACINFMNLATARSEKRAKEVGIRKSIGSSRGEIIVYFLGESVLISLIAFSFSLLMSAIALPMYNTLVSKELFIDYSSGSFLLLSFGLIVFTGLISGAYPAFYLSSFQPAQTLKGKVNVGKSGSTPRKVLVVLQFAFSIFLMIGTVVIYRQIEMVKDRELGYEQENLIAVELTDELKKNYDVLKLELQNSGAIEAMTRSNSSITNINSNNFLGWPGKPEDLRVLFTTITCEYDYAETMGIKVLEGRDFSKDFKTDTAALVVNKAAIDVMGIENPIGTELDLWGSKFKLIGVVDNVLMGSLYENVKPMFMKLDDWGGYITIRLKRGQDLSGSLSVVQGIFEKYNPAYPFDYKFMDEDFQKKFETINMTQQLAGVFSVLAILITGLGLFGLASFMAEQRTKEIGIRKVLGASVVGLVTLMSRDFARLIVISFILSAPMGYWMMNQYLERYPLRTTINWWIYPLVGILSLVFALLIVSNQAYKAAHANPAHSLKNE
ncbi:MAG: ABC transporter permease [Cyclobacteriaceae bacterium]|nr:ABC transporter permease [Cyclobacteriaceae bacterium]